MSQILHMPPQKAHSHKAARCIMALLMMILFCTSGLGYWLYQGRLESEQVKFESEVLPIQAGMTSTIEEILARPGEKVRKGQSLLRLEGGSWTNREAEARALVHGTFIPRAEDTAERVNAARAAEEFMVRQVALARHEEDAQKKILEQRSTDHARAQIQLRDLDARGGAVPSTRRDNAVRAEREASARLESAKSGFEAASRNRAAIEGELLRARLEVERARSRASSAPLPTGGNARQSLLISEDPSLLTAPADGILTGALPKVGQTVRRGETVLVLAPESLGPHWAVALVSQKEAQFARPGQLCYLEARHMPGVWIRGEVESLLPPETSNTPGRPTLTPLRIRITDKNINATQLLGATGQTVLWTNTPPALRLLEPVLRWFSRF